MPMGTKIRLRTKKKVQRTPKLHSKGMKRRMTQQLLENKIEDSEGMEFPKVHSTTTKEV